MCVCVCVVGAWGTPEGIPLPPPLGFGTPQRVRTPTLGIILGRLRPCARAVSERALGEAAPTFQLLQAVPSCCPERSTQTCARVPADLAQASDGGGGRLKEVVGFHGFLIRKPSQNIANIEPIQRHKSGRSIKINGNRAWQIASNDRFSTALLATTRLARAVAQAYEPLEYTRNLKSSWPKTGRHSHTNYIPVGVRNHRIQWMVNKKCFVLKIKLTNP